ncbi:hypothetical protein SAMN05444166_7523 [Singulisphaera sp. GP187]|nr:hypothetical protein SAMN05444166_7523 [Singulisphaera sp. GP187]
MRRDNPVATGGYGVSLCAEVVGDPAAGPESCTCRSNIPHGVFSTYPSLTFLAIILAVSAIAFSGLSNDLVVDCPLVPILPYLVVMSLPSWETSQNLLEVPAMNSK